MAGGKGGGKIFTKAAGILLKNVDLVKGRKYPHSQIPTPQTAVSARPDFTPSPNRGGPPGSRPNKPFTGSGKDEVKQRNAQQNGGRAHCANCNAPLVNPKQSKKGHRPPENEAHVDHRTPQSKGGSGDPSNGQCLCRACNLAKSNK
ncbi:HNH endonuclease [Propionibacteriaceae bacterium G1746]